MGKKPKKKDGSGDEPQQPRQQQPSSQQSQGEESKQRPPQGQQQQRPPQGQQQQRPPQGQQPQGQQQRQPQGQQPQGQQQRQPQGQQQQQRQPQGQQEQQRQPQGQQQRQPQGQRPQQEQQRPPQGQQQQRPSQGQQQPQGQGQRPQQEQQRPPQGQQQQRPSQGQQQSWGQQQGQGKRPQQEQQRPSQGQPQSWGQQQMHGQKERPPQGQQQGWAQQQSQQQQRPPQGQQSSWGQQQSQQQGQQQQRPAQGQQQAWGQQQSQQQRPQHGQQQPRPAQGQQQSQQQRPQQGQGQQYRQQEREQRPPQAHSASPQKSGVVETNFLELDLSNMPRVAYHYDVTVEPDKPKKFIRQAFSLFSKNYPKIAMAFDGVKSCYLVQKLPHNTATHEVEVPDSAQRKLKFKVTLKETADMEVDLNSLRNYKDARIYDKPMRALQCLEVVLANPCHGIGVRAGRSFYKRPDQKQDLSDGYELWTGLYQAAILGDQPFLNVDIAHKSFPSGALLTDFMLNSRMNIQNTLEGRDISFLNDYLKMLNIVYNPPACLNSLPRTYHVNSVSTVGADKLSFTMDDGSKPTVAAYFKSKGYILKYPRLNCLHVGSTTKNIYLPIELCSIQDGQVTNKKCGPRQTAAIIKYAATSTNVRKKKIEELMTYFNHNKDAIVHAFGIKLKLDFIDVPTRCLPPPMLIYNGKRTVQPRNGSWRSNNSFYETKSDKNNNFKWVIIYLGDDRNLSYDRLTSFKSMLLQNARPLNVRLDDNPELVKVTARNEKDPQHYKPVLNQLKAQGVQLVVVILSAFGYSYADIKQVAELKLGLLTQCVKSDTAMRRQNDMTMGNLLLKINAKLNGTNHIAESNKLLNINTKKIMFMGADVTHPSPDQRHIPSVVGTAASHDLFGSCYNMQYRLQRSTLETIEDMEEITYYHLCMYKKHVGCYPTHVIYYRDGVSDGQFPIVDREELAGMRRTFSRLGLKNIGLTCIVTVKRHHTRFFPKDVNQYDKFNNVAPGTLVDKRIVHPNEMEFYMVSHQSIQGTAKPTRYNVIYDNQNLTIAQVQEMSHALCHIFPRCNRAVSYPTPVYLAHLVAARGRVYIDGQNLKQDLKVEYSKRLISDIILQNNPMYFV